MGFTLSLVLSLNHVMMNIEDVNNTVDKVIMITPSLILISIAIRVTTIDIKYPCSILIGVIDLIFIVLLYLLNNAPCAFLYPLGIA